MRPGANDVAAVRLAMRDDDIDIVCRRDSDKLIEPLQPTPDRRCVGREERSRSPGVLIVLPCGVHAVQGEFQLAAKRHLSRHRSREGRNCLWRSVQTHEHVLEGTRSSTVSALPNARGSPRYGYTARA